MNNRWMDDAACATVATDEFFPDRGDNRAANQARLICSTCPVIAECLAYAQQVEFEYGIFGGLAPLDRRKLRSTA